MTAAVTGPPIEVTSQNPLHVDDRLFVTGWDGLCLAQSPRRLRSAARDRRWDTTWVLAARDGVTLGVLPVQRSRSGVPPAAFYDPAMIAPDLVARVSAPDPSWCYVGGFKDLISGVTLAAGLSAVDRDHVRQALLAQAYAEAERQGGIPIALYVRDAELPSYRAALGDRLEASQVSDHAVIDLRGASLESHVAGLPKKIRYRIRREWQELTDRGLRAQEQPATEICGEAAGLVAAVKQRHGTQDHPRMAEMRLREWADSDADEALAMTLRAPDGKLLGAVFVGRFGTAVEVNELGLADDVAGRHLLYTELLVHAPMRYAVRHGCHRLTLGLDSVAPKALRGARIEPVWAVGVRAAA